MRESLVDYKMAIMVLVIAVATTVVSLVNGYYPIAVILGAFHYATAYALYLSDKNKVYQRTIQQRKGQELDRVVQYDLRDELRTDSMAPNYSVLFDKKRFDEEVRLLEKYVNEHR